MISAAFLQFAFQSILLHRIQKLLLVEPVLQNLNNSLPVGFWVMDLNELPAIVIQQCIIDQQIPHIILVLKKNGKRRCVMFLPPCISVQW